MEFEAARQALMAGERPGGIGILREKTLHGVLKLWLDEDMTHHEVRLPDGHVADIFDGRRITEVQTAGMSPLRPKLMALLDTYPVTVVCPLVRDSFIRWIDPATGDITAPRRSSRRGGFTDGAEKLVYLLPCLFHPHLTVRLLLLDVEEHRLADGYGKDGHRRAHRVERYPMALVEELTLTEKRDYAALLPVGLPEPFTADQFGKAARLRGRRMNGALKVLREAGCLTRDESTRPYRYSTVEW